MFLFVGQRSREVDGGDTDKQNDLLLIRFHKVVYYANNTILQDWLIEIKDHTDI